MGESSVAAAFAPMRRPGGRELLERHYRAFAELGTRLGLGVILETATWRASADWGARLGDDAPTVRMAVDEAGAYHRPPLAAFAAASSVDLVVVPTLGYVEEVLGVAAAARSLPVPLVLSFTVETDGRLPSGWRRGAAVVRTSTWPRQRPA
jgi:S-methylmethionine-dependent homocysteine/selenocysteine methylase